MPTPYRLPIRPILAGIAAGSLVALGPVGCQAKPPVRTAESPLAAGIDVNNPDLVRDLALYRKDVNATAMAIWRRAIDSASTTEVRDRAELARRRTLNAIANAYRSPNALGTLLELWWLLDRYQTFVNSDDARNLFREDPFAREQTKVMHEGILAIARKFIPANRFAQVESEIDKVAATDRIEYRDFEEDSSTAATTGLFDSGAGAGVASVLGLPLSPFTAAQSVSDAARTSEEQMKRVADSVDGYPDRIRDILEDTMEEFYSSSLAKSAETAMRDGGESSRRIADAAERLPADVDRALATARDEAAKLLDEIAAKSAEFRGLLETYRQAAADTERSLAAGRAAIADANTLADKATATAAAWEKTATEAEKTIALVRDLVAENDAAPGPDDDFSFERLERLAGDTQQALAELRATIADARGLANDPALAAFEQRANAILDGAQDRVDASIDRAARWSLAVLAIAMVLGSGLIVLARKLRGSS
jgi:hypothetical protein